MPAQCQHCGNVKFIKRRGLCNACYRTPSIALQYPDNRRREEPARQSTKLTLDQQRRLTEIQNQLRRYLFKVASRFRPDWHHCEDAIGYGMVAACESVVRRGADTHVFADAKYGILEAVRSGKVRPTTSTGSCKKRVVLFSSKSLEGL